MKDHDKKLQNINRQDLYELVWSKSTSALSKEMGLSTVKLKKMCRNHNVPMPGAAYWNKLRFDKNLKPIPLPTDENKVTKQPSIQPTLKENYSTNPQSRVAGKDAGISVLEEIVDPHILVKQTIQFTKGSGINTSRICVIDESCLNVQVSPENLERSMRIFDALIKALIERGCTIVLKEKQISTTVLIKGEPVSISISEQLTRKNLPLSNIEEKKYEEYPWLQKDRPHIMVPNGYFEFNLDTEYGYGIQKRWSESSNRRLERLLSGIVVGLWRAAEISLKARQEYEARKKEYEERERREEEKRQKINNERNRIKVLHTTLKLWDRRNKILSLANEVEKRAQLEDEHLVKSDEISSWLEWARNYANSIDPINLMIDPSESNQLFDDYWADIDQPTSSTYTTSFNYSEPNHYWRRWWNK